MIDTTTNFRECPSGKRSAAVTICSDGGQIYRLSSDCAPLIGILDTFASSVSRGTWEFGNHGYIIKGDDGLILEVVQDDTASCLRFRLAPNSANRRYVTEILRLTEWCTLPGLGDDGQIGSYLVSDRGLKSVTTNAVIRPEVVPLSEPVIEQSSPVAEQATVEEKIAHAQVIFQEKQRLVRAYQALLDQIEHPAISHTDHLLDNALVFADEFCSCETMNELIHLSEQYRAMISQITQKVQCLITELE